MKILWEGAPIDRIAEAKIVPLRVAAVIFFSICLGLFFWAELWVAILASIFSVLIFILKFRSFRNHSKKFSSAKYVYTGDTLTIFSIDGRILDSYSLGPHSCLTVRRAKDDEYISVEWLPEVKIKGGLANLANGLLYIEPESAHALIALLDGSGARLKFVN